MEKIYCSKCRFFSEDLNRNESTCAHQSNIREYDTYKERKTEFISFPRYLNKKNDCKNFGEFK